MSMYLLLWCYNNRRSTLNTFILFSAMTVHTIVDPILATADIIILHVNCIAATATVCIGSCRIGAAAVELGGGGGGGGGGAVGGWGGVVGGGLGWGGGGGARSVSWRTAAVTGRRVTRSVSMHRNIIRANKGRRYEVR